MLIKVTHMHGHMSVTRTFIDTSPKVIRVDTPYDTARAPPTSTGTAIFIAFEGANISLYHFQGLSFMCSLAMQCGALRLKKENRHTPSPHLCGITSNMNLVWLKGLLEMNMI